MIHQSGIGILVKNPSKTRNRNDESGEQKMIAGGQKLFSTASRRSSEKRSACPSR